MTMFLFILSSDKIYLIIEVICMVVDTWSVVCLPFPLFPVTWTNWWRKKKKWLTTCFYWLEKKFASTEGPKISGKFGSFQLWSITDWELQRKDVQFDTVACFSGWVSDVLILMYYYDYATLLIFSLSLFFLK